MPIGDGVNWNEALPDNSTVANQIDDYNRDLRVGARARLAREHVWPSSQTSSNEAGNHSYISFQAQTAPAMAGTTAGALYVTSSSAGYALVFLNSAGAGVTLVGSAGVLPVCATGTQGGIIIASSASPTTVQVLAASAPGMVLHTHTGTADANWLPIDLAGTSTVLSGVLPAAYGGLGTPLKFAYGAITMTGGAVYTANLGVTYSDTAYSVMLANMTADTGDYYILPHVTSRVTTSFDIRNNGYSNVVVLWVTVGT